MIVWRNVPIILVSGLLLGTAPSDNPLKDWGFAYSLNTITKPVTTVDFTIDQWEQAEIDFKFEKAPKLLITPIGDSKLQRELQFSSKMPQSKTESRVVFVTPTVKGAGAKLPWFTLIRKPGESSSVSFLSREFRDYGNDYFLEISFVGQPGNYSVSYLSCFSEPAEHHIYGEVELFGIRFKSDSKSPLVFRIEDGKYKYISGRGAAIDGEGSTFEYGK